MATLVLLPGMDGTGSLFAPFVHALGPALRSVVLRYPVTGPQSYERLTEFVDQALPAAGPLVLLGESFSGPIAVTLAARHPTRVAGLVLCCTFLRNPRALAAPLMRLAARLPLPAPPAFVAARALLGDAQTPALRAALKAALAEVPAAVLRARLGEVARVDVSAAARRVAVPTLYLRATRDRLVRATAADEVRAAIPGAAVVDVDGPHCLLQAAPQATASAVAGFVRALAPGVPSGG
ncbi:MAG: alpha/beta fold hydrolase [Bordetella sp.]|nr:alpha/beta fold hydrolase [Bordetella sp.]